MSTESKIRVLIAEDSTFMRRVLKALLSSDPSVEVVGEARDGEEAVLQSEALKPDVITMDINMPKKSGLEATEAIMSLSPRPIVIVSSEARDGAEPTLRALELGAIDFVPKPANGIDLDMESVRDELLRKIKLASKVRVVRNASRPRPLVPKVDRLPLASMDKNAPKAPLSVGIGALASKQATQTNGAERLGQPGERFPVVVVAASTGGPAALMNFLPQFSQHFRGAVILIQHMPATFTKQFSEQLSEACAIRVKEAETGELMRPGFVYLCPGANHLRLSPSGRLLLDEGPRFNGHRPSADITLESVSDYAGPLAVAVIMTGMGNDGALGVRKIKAAGGHVIVQDEATCVIFGMPSEAIKTGAVDQILPLNSIYSAIERRLVSAFALYAGAL